MKIEYMNSQQRPTTPMKGGKVIVGQYVDLAQSDQTPDWMPTYKNLPIHSLPELHSRIGELLQAHLKAGDSVLDIGAGTGALSLRIRDLGYEVTACDYVTTNFRLHNEVPFHQVNLNLDFLENIKCQFDCIVASEILEHIENPRHVVRHCARLLKPSGFLVITTPNIESSFSIAMRLRNGHFSLFDEAFYQRDGHITPITSSTLKRSLEESNFKIEHFQTYGGFSPAPWWKLRALIHALDFLRLDKEISNGSSLVTVARLQDADIPHPPTAL